MKDNNIMHLTNDLPMAGDIILVESTSPKSLVNTGLQRLVRLSFSGTSFVPSHAALAVNGSGLFMHATKGKKVDYTSVSYLIDEIRYKRYKVYRNTSLESLLMANPEEDERISALAIKFWGEMYELYPLINRDAQGVFCSMLVSKIYDSLDMKLSKRESRHVLPVDLEKDLRRNEAEWRDVTSSYQRFYDLKNNEADAGTIKKLRDASNQLAHATSMVRNIEALNRNLEALDRKILGYYK